MSGYIYRYGKEILPVSEVIERPHREIGGVFLFLLNFVISLGKQN